MKLLLALLCLLLCGCAQEPPAAETPIPTIAETVTAETAPVSMYEPGHPLEAHWQGNLKVYPLTMRKVRFIRSNEYGVFAFSGYGSTTITYLTGEELTVSASLTLDFELSDDEPSLQVSPEGLSFFDPSRNLLVVLSNSLQETRRIVMPGQLLGSPILSTDRSTVFYCTAEAILAWDLESGIHRTVKELSYDSQTLSGLHLGDTVLQCRIQDGGNVQTLFLSAETGQLLSQQSGDAQLITLENRFYAALPVGGLEMLIFGDADGSPQILYPEDLAANNFYLPSRDSLLTASLLDDDQVVLHDYDLSTGLRKSQLTLPALQMPKSVTSGSGETVFLLAYDPDRDCDTLYRWAPDAPVFSPDSDETVYTLPYGEALSQDAAAIAQCQSRAAQLSEKYGIQIRIGEEALVVQPWDYAFEAESQPQVILQELALLDQRLGKYPQAVLDQTKSHFASLSICLVRQITGTAASGNLDSATGIQFLENADAYVVITAGKYSQQALYHEFFHLMETHILNESSALDQWESLNPEGFAYSYGYHVSQDISAYLSGSTRAFVDSYCTTFPREDRARIFENAMLPGNDALFAPTIMQDKLTALCQGIRQAYRLRKSPEIFPWEQYLNLSLAYTD